MSLIFKYLAVSILFMFIGFMFGQIFIPVSFVYYANMIFMFLGQCRNCRAPSDASLCRTCASRRRCSHCKRHLCEGLFESPEVEMCKTCVRKSLNTGVKVSKTAFSGLLEEVAMDTQTDDNCDLQAFLENRQTEIIDTLRRSVERNK